MAFNRAVLHRDWSSGSPAGEWVGRLWRWRQWALLLLAVIAGAMATVSLVKNPPDKPPMSTSYLPESQIGSP
ncbi:hypothetical protein [Steroidobacter cummioxidans]|uniref:hypothetical protein n=1 Tax=Steroidobacter cummioxidans TaxID=1803913 RepID=UPI00128FDE0C|nr:hypothetical protein [Steroidobacter cummioxidans]